MGNHFLAFLAAVLAVAVWPLALRSAARARRSLRSFSSRRMRSFSSWSLQSAVIISNGATRSSECDGHGEFSRSAPLLPQVILLRAQRQQLLLVLQILMDSFSLPGPLAH